MNSGSVWSKLSLASCGRLVTQDSSEEPAINLLESISKEKERLVTEKKIRNPKSLPPIGDEEIKTQIPENWLLRRLGEVSIAITKGATPTTYGFAYQSSGVSFIKVENIADGRIHRSGLSEFIGDDAHEAFGRSQLQAGDVLFSIAGTIGKTCIVREEDLPANTNQALAIVRGTSTVFEPQYLQNVLDSAVSEWMHEKARGGAMKNVSLGDLTNLPVPIPPMPEQRRIVAKVRELTALCDDLEARLECARDTRSAFARSAVACFA